MLRVAAQIDMGQERDNNDDRILVGDRMLREGTYEESSPGNRLLVALADGVGGTCGGGQAAERALSSLAGINQARLDEAVLKTAFARASAEISRLQAENEEVRHMATTLTGVFINGVDLFTFNVGDSRVYRYRGGVLRRLTRDHSRIQELLDLGLITAAEAQGHPEQHVITRCLGYEGRDVPDIAHRKEWFLPGDLLLLCSDGLTDYVRENTIERLLRPVTVPIKHRLDSLVSAAIKAGGHDNISAVIVLNEQEG